MILLKKPVVVCFLKGATAYELQIWRFGARWCHLTGGNGYYGWKINVFKRLTFQYFDPKIYGNV